MSDGARSGDILFNNMRVRFNDAKPEHTMIVPQHVVDRRVDDFER